MKFTPTKWRHVLDPYVLNVDYRKETYKNPLTGYAYCNNAAGIGKLGFGYEVRWRAYYEPPYIKVTDESTVVQLVEAPGVLSLDAEFDTSGNPVVIFHQSETGGGRNPGIYIYYKNAYTQVYGAKLIATLGQDVAMTWYNKNDDRAKDLVAIFLDDTDTTIKYTCLSSNFATVISTGLKGTEILSAFAVTGRTSPEIAPGYNMGPSVSIRYNYRMPNFLMRFTGANGSTDFSDKFRGPIAQFETTTAAISTTAPGKPNGVLSVANDPVGLTTTLLVPREVQPSTDRWAFRIGFRMTQVGTTVGTLMAFVNGDDRFGVYVTSGSNPRAYFRSRRAGVEANVDPTGIAIQLNTWIDLTVIRYFDRVVYFVNQLPVYSADVPRDLALGDTSVLTVGANFFGYIDYAEFKTEGSDRWLNPMQLTSPNNPPSSFPNNLLLLLDLRDERNYDDPGNTGTYTSPDASSYHRAFESGRLYPDTRGEMHSPYFGGNVPTDYRDPRYPFGIRVPYFDYGTRLRTSGSTNDFKNLTGWFASIWIFKPQYSDPYNIQAIFTISDEAPEQYSAPDVGTQGAFISDESLSNTYLGNGSGKNCPVFIRGSGLPNPTVIWSGTPLREKTWTQVDYLYWDNYLVIYTDGRPSGGGPLPGGLLNVNGAFAFQNLFSTGGLIANTNFLSTGFQFWRLNDSTDLDNLNSYRSLDVVNDRLIAPFVY